MSDQEIVQQCQQGSLEAFDKLYERYFERIYRFVYYKTMHKQIAQDITSETFIKALDNIKSFRKKKGSFMAWIYSIARNNVINYYRKSSRALLVNDFWDLKIDQSLEFEQENTELLKKIKKQLFKLDSLQREIIILRVWQQLSYKEISAIVNKSEENCRVIFCRGIKNIRKEILLAIFVLPLIFCNYEIK